MRRQAGPEDRSLHDLAHSTIVLPDSTPPVSIARLSMPGRGAMSALVRFPPGWSRPGSGRYAVDEAVVVLEGDLTVTGRTAKAGQALWIAAEADRSASFSKSGALCFARFGGPPPWVPGPGGRSGGVHGPDLLPPVRTPLGVPGRALATGADGPGLWLLADGLPALEAPADLELIALGERRWVRASAGQRLPTLAGPCWALLPVASTRP